MSLAVILFILLIVNIILGGPVWLGVLLFLSMIVASAWRLFIAAIALLAAARTARRHPPLY